MSATATQWAFQQTGLSASQKFVLVFYAWKADDEFFTSWPSQNTVARCTGLGVKTVKRAIKELLDLGFLVQDGHRFTLRTEDGKRRETNAYKIPVNASFKDKTTGKSVDIDAGNWGHSDPSSIQLGSQCPPTGVTVTPNILDKLYLYIYTPAAIEIELPPEITPEQFNQFIQHRLELKKLKKKPLNQRVAKLAINEMLKLVRQGQDLSACLNQMEMKGWDQPYPVKKEQRGGGNEKRQSDRKRTDREILEDERRKFEERRRAKAAGVDDDGIIQGEFHRC